jgi:hypothetical protein
MRPVRSAAAVILVAVIGAGFIHAAETAWYLPPAAAAVCVVTSIATRFCVDRADRRRRP